MVDWQSPITVQNELGASILNVFEVFFPRLIASNFSFSVTGRRLCQNRTCHRRNLYVRFSPPLCLERSYCHRAQGSRSVHVSWEFICNIGFEYDLLRGRRLWRWTAAVSVTPSLFTPPSLHQSYHIPSGNQRAFFLFVFFSHRFTLPVGSVPSPKRS